jgi:hypothetical protein
LGSFVVYLRLPMRVATGERHIAVDAPVFYEVNLFSKCLRNGDGVTAGEFFIGIVPLHVFLALGFGIGRCEVMPSCEGVEILQIEVRLGAGRGRFHDRVGDVLGQSRRLVEVPEGDLVGPRQQILRGGTLPRVVLLLEVGTQIVLGLGSLL